jgi:hypothetical protein
MSSAKSEPSLPGNASSLAQHDQVTVERGVGQRRRAAEEEGDLLERPLANARLPFPDVPPLPTGLAY